MKTFIGLEVHVELNTKSKMFCNCSANYFGKKPNTHTCPVCLGLPGALPVPNKKALEYCLMIGLSLNCRIPKFSKFDRKNYFYPDLPKGYQVSQYDQPFCENGFLEIDHKKIGITRVHMEEDTGKLIHENDSTLIDFNRSGVPLVEIVTEPDFENSKEVKLYLQKLQQIVRYLNVAQADMEKGQMRLEPNISVSLDGKLPNYKVEVKNINSFSFVEKAINYELKRQKELLESGKIPTQETRGWNEKKQTTVAQRIKEEANDYRYFPEPDIPPITWGKSQILNLKSQMPQLPDEKLSKFIKDYKLSYYDSEILTRTRDLADYFEEAVKVGKKHELTPKKISNIIINKKIDTEKVLPAELVKTIIGSKVALIDDKELEELVVKIIKENSKAVEDYKNGKEQALMFLVGQVMRLSKQKLDSNQVKDKIKQQIKK